MICREDTTPVRKGYVSMVVVSVQGVGQARSVFMKSGFVFEPNLHAALILDAAPRSMKTPP